MAYADGGEPLKGASLFGLGLRQPHISQVIAGEASVGWFEIISENYMDSCGKSLVDLQQVAERYPLAFHGVSLSIGSTDPLNIQYLSALKSLAKRIPPLWISDHLCWTGIHNKNSHDLLPMPLTEESLNHVVTRVNQVQDYLETQIILENPSSYGQFKQSDLDEPDFLRALCKATGCGILLDVNNVFVSCYNGNQDPMQYLERFPFEFVKQMHLAGHQDCGDYMIDTHDRPVRAETWALFAYAWNRTDGVATCLEWDSHIPSLAVCQQEIYKACHYISEGPGDLADFSMSKASASALFSDAIHKTDQDAVSTPLNFLVPDVMDFVSED